MAYIRFEKKRIYYKDAGKGKPIVLLHGFTESSAIWTSFAKKLSAKYRVVLIDLPGHGRSSVLGPVHTMDRMADAVQAVLKKIRAGKTLMAGHSMGGYVALAYAARYPDRLRGLCLFHSHCFADTETDRTNRDRTIGVVEKDKMGFVAGFIPDLFPAETRHEHGKKITRLVHRAAKMEKEGVIAALEGMKVRPDQTETLRTVNVPVLFILGQKDSRAPVDRFGEMVALPAQSHVLLLRECGHMGFIEYPDATLAALAAFARSVLS